MALLSYLYASALRRIDELRRTDPADRGDSPVPTAIIIAGLAVLAAGILAVAATAIDGWTALIPPAVAP
ncbi:hypothetical protein ACFOX0_27675 [Micromonospora zhanjiangensis]|uniref:Uncharacterized protein n=1 Tax=Micromonospora zhanjiangensis TaxID=1522057 RepID=A0ABV8KV28_9ACTN